MPIYEYRCGACGHEQEILRKMSDAPLTLCPACGKESLTKLVSAAGFQLKGSGWYATDFKGGGKHADKADGAGDDAKATSEAKATSDSTGKDESKPKQESKPKEEAKSTVSAAGATPAAQ